MSKQLPARPDLNWLKNRARERLVELRAKDGSAKLAEAQRAVAREYGFGSWRQMKAFVDVRAAVAVAVVQTRAQPPALDEEQEKTLLDQFRAAIGRGEVEEVRRMLGGNSFFRERVNSPIFEFDGRPIGRAKLNPAMVDLLLEYGADINLKSGWQFGGWGVLDDCDQKTGEFLISRGAVVDIFAAANLNRLDRMKELLDKNPELVRERGGDGCYPLHFARSAEGIDLLLSRGAEIDARDLDHVSTAAQWAVPHPPGQRRRIENRGDLARVRHLLNRGASADIFMAAALNDVQRLGEIVRGQPELIDVRVGDKSYQACPPAPGQAIYVYTLGAGKTAHQVAREFGSEACYALLLDTSNPKQRFLAACSVADEATARAMLATSPRMVLSLSPEDQRLLPNAAFQGDAAAVKLMLDLNFDPRTPGSNGGTALHCAAWVGRADIVGMILDHPVTGPMRDQLINATEAMHGSTPLGWCCHGSTACRNPEGDYPAVAKMLLEAGATIGPNEADANPAVREVLEARARSKGS
jgi:ankyrin repeat protein